MVLFWLSQELHFPYLAGFQGGVCNRLKKYLVYIGESPAKSMYFSMYIVSPAMSGELAPSAGSRQVYKSDRKPETVSS